MRRLNVATSLLAALALSVTVAAPVMADTVSLRDPAGDARARYDLTTIRATNAVNRIAVTARVGNLRGTGTQTVVLGIDPVRGETDYWFSSVRRANGRANDSLTGYTSDSASPIDCNITTRWQLAKNLIRISIPRACIEEQGTLRFNLAMGAGNGTTGQPADWTKALRVRQD